MASTDECVDELRAEIDRLQQLVGPSERSYRDLYDDLLAARDVAKGAEAAAGQLRGEVAALHVALSRAQQDQDHFQRIVWDRARSLSGRMSRSVRGRFF